MALKEDIKAIKEEIGAEEQFLESIIKGERFYKKYKFPIIAFVSLVILVAIGYATNDYMDKRSLRLTNEAYELLLKNPDNKEALKTLKDGNLPLYETYLFSQSSKNKNIDELKKLLSSNLDPVLKDMIKFELGEDDSEIYKNLKALLDGYSLLKQGKTQEAKSAFSLIPLTSNLQEIVKKLNHYQGNKQWKKSIYV